jgi:hypothetical protein
MEEVIQRFNERGVRYLVIGGQAMRLQGMPRFSMDWDVFLPGKDSANLRLINELLPEDLDIPAQDQQDIAFLEKKKEAGLL